MRKRQRALKLFAVAVAKQTAADCYSACNFDPLGAGIGVQN
jgi:hypothetical protein